MDHWFTILLLLIFFVFPLIQQMLGARKGRSPEPVEHKADPTEEEWVPVERTKPGRSEARPATRSAEQGANWSESWGRWPGSEAEVETANIEVDEQVRRALEAQLREPVAVQPAPPAPARAAKLKAARASRVKAERPPRGLRPKVKPRERHEFVSDLTQPRGLRRAIILNEVLGKPVSLRNSGRDDVPQP
jgi:hypothetical protein